MVFVSGPATKVLAHLFLLGDGRGLRGAVEMKLVVGWIRVLCTVVEGARCSMCCWFWF